MREVPVAFPSDETTAGVIVSRLAVDGITARVDRGLYGSWQVASPGQIRILVGEQDARRAHMVLGTRARAPIAPGPFLRAAVALLFGALAVGVAAIVLLVAQTAAK